MCNLGFFITVIFLHAFISGTSSHRYFCPDYRPQRIVDMEKVKGSWSVMEILTHEGGTDEEPNRIDQSEACADFKIEQETEDGNLTIVNEAGGNTRTYFYATKSDKESGLWMISGPYNEEVSDQSARILNGNAQILKAVDEYMILTICTEQEQETEVYSFVLVKESHSLPSPDFFDYVNNLLQRKRLDILHTVRFLCSTKNSETTESEIVKSEEKETISSASIVTSVLYLKIIMIFMFKFLA